MHIVRNFPYFFDAFTGITFGSCEVLLHVESMRIEMAVKLLPCKSTLLAGRRLSVPRAYVVACADKVQEGGKGWFMLKYAY
jgi:hypothetical protein